MSIETFNIEVISGSLVWNSGDVRNLTLAVNESEFYRASATSYTDNFPAVGKHVFNVLLQALDDGRLTDGQGRTVNFANTMVILTSNLGSEYLAALPDAADASGAESDVMAAVRASFRPEFLNRLDDIVLFNRLSREHMDSIVDIQVVRLETLLADRMIGVALDESARSWLADAGYDPVYGARPLRRVIQRSLQNQLANLILSSNVLEGDVVQVTAGPDGLTLRTASTASS